MRLVRRLYAVLSMAWLPVAGPAAASDIWLAPLPPSKHADGSVHGQSDYMALFEPGASWRAVAERVKVFKLYLGFVRDSSDSDLRRLLDWLRSHGIALALETPVLVDTGWCQPGTVHQAWMLGPVRRLSQLGADLRYLAMVGPLVDGHVSTGPSACHRPITEVAADAARTVAAMRQLFPNLVVGEIEPVNDGPGFPTTTELASWLDTFAAASGHPVAFLHADTLWGGIWRPRLQAIAALSHDRGIPFGVIYGGGNGELSDAGFAQDSLLHAEQAESLLGHAPDHVIFQSWGEYPRHALPETDPTTQTGIVRAYLRPPSSFSRAGRMLRLSGPGDAPISDAALIAEVHDPAPGASFQLRTIEGDVPQDAVAALFGLRAHTECATAEGPVDMRLAGFTFEQPNSGAQPFARDLGSWGNAWPGVVTKEALHGSPVIHVDAAPAQRLVLNGPSFPVVPNQPFTARFAWQVESAAAEAGCAVMIFLDRTGVERHRLGLPFATSWQQRARLRTGADGTLPVPPMPAGPALRFRYEGDSSHRPAQIVLSSPADP